MFVERFNNCINFKVKEVQIGDFLENGKVLIVFGDKYMIIRKVGSMYKVECFYGDKVNGYCLFVDVLFELVVKVCGNKVIGIIFIGMGYDGVKGFLFMRKCGVRILG